jgi:glycosyltransferase involved in cell wall biosynthesis
MKILQICPKPPFPPSDGGTIAMNNLTQGLLKAGVSVKVLALETPKHSLQTNNIPNSYIEKTQLETVYADTSVRVPAAARGLFSRRSYQVDRFYSKAFAAKIAEVLKNGEYDIVHLESVYTTPYIPVIRQYSKARIVLRTHNVEHLIWQRMARNEQNLAKRWAIKIFSNQLKRYECSLESQVDGFAAISTPDNQFFKEICPQVPCSVIPFGIDLDDYEPEEDYMPSDKPELFHIGSMDWMPNVEGVEWFLDEVWPSILQEFPEVTFTIAGRKIPAEISRRTDRNVVVAGEVASANEFMLSKDIMIVPILAGSGIRVKIIEGMALGKVIITTTIGAEGLDVENGKNILIADTPEEFVSAVEKCVKTPDLCAILGENARNFVSLNHNNEQITLKLIDFYRSLLG